MSGLSIEIAKIEHIVIIKLAGGLSVLDTGLRQVAQQLIDRGEWFFIVNLANVSYMDNSGLGQLCLLYTMARNRGGNMKLLKPTLRIKKLLNITKLDTVFECFDHEADAIASMAGPQMMPLSMSAKG